MTHYELGSSGTVLKLKAAKASAVTTGKDIKITLTEDLGSAQITAKITAADAMTLTKKTDSTFDVKSNYADLITADVSSAQALTTTWADLGTNNLQIKLKSALPNDGAGNSIDAVKLAADESTDVVTVSAEGTGTVAATPVVIQLRDKTNNNIVAEITVNISVATDTPTIIVQ